MPGYPSSTVYPSSATFPGEEEGAGVVGTLDHAQLGVGQLGAFQSGSITEGHGPVLLPPALTKPGAQSGTIGQPTALVINNSGGAAETPWTVTGLPPGLKVVAESGTLLQIEGTPTTAGSSTVTVTAKNAVATETVTFTWTIAPLPAPSIVNPGTQSSSGARTLVIQNVGGAVNTGGWNVTGLPPGFTIVGQTATTVTISGSSTTVGTYTVTATATNGTGTASATFTWTVTSAPVSVSPYTLRLGPLAFIAPLDAVGETIGDGLDVVGAGIAPSERKPRPLKLGIAIRGEAGWDTDPVEIGKRLRRQIRQLFENTRYRKQGLFLWWEPDSELDCWLMIGGAELAEDKGGLTFGEYNLALTDVYIAGRPGTHRPGRRVSAVDLRKGEAPRDTRGFIYSTDFAAFPAAFRNLILPGDVVQVRSSSGRNPSTGTGTMRGTRRLFTASDGQDGEALSYFPDPNKFTSRLQYLELDELGSVRVWDLANAATYPPAEGSYSTAGDEAPDQFYGWERLYGAAFSVETKLAIENGLIRLWWDSTISAIRMEWWDPSTNHYVQAGEWDFGTSGASPATGPYEVEVVELTPERGVVEIRAGRLACRVILQRGWTGPRMEAYDDSGASGPVIRFRPLGPGATLTWNAANNVAYSSAMFRTFKGTGENPENHVETLVVFGTADMVKTGAGAYREFGRSTAQKAMVLTAAVRQLEGTLAVAEESLARRSVSDYRPVPVLVKRGG